MIVVCKECGIELSKEIKLLKDIKLLKEIDGDDYVPQGFYIIAAAGFCNTTKQKISVNTNDLINSKDHPDYKRLFGCCGLAGLDGFNKTCINGHEIGTMESDCWEVHSMIFEPDLVIIDEKAKQ